MKVPESVLHGSNEMTSDLIHPTKFLSEGKVTRRTSIDPAELGKPQNLMSEKKNPQYSDFVPQLQNPLSLFRSFSQNPVLYSNGVSTGSTPVNAFSYHSGTKYQTGYQTQTQSPSFLSNVQFTTESYTNDHNFANGLIDYNNYTPMSPKLVKPSTLNELSNSYVHPNESYNYFTNSNQNSISYPNMLSSAPNTATKNGKSSNTNKYTTTNEISLLTELVKSHSKQYKSMDSDPVMAPFNILNQKLEDNFPLPDNTPPALPDDTPPRISDMSFFFNGI